MLILLLAAAPLVARDALYLGEARAESASPSARAPLLLALNQVLVRLTGLSGQDLVGEASVDEATAAGMALGRQFRQVEMLRSDGVPRSERRLQVEFDPVAVDQLIDQQGWPRWSGVRPVLLLWVAEERDQGAAYLEDAPWLQALIDESARRYGLALVRPILDGLDRAEVRPVDIRGGFTATSAAARNRYAADGVVMLDLRQRAGLVDARWAWQLGPREQSLNVSGAGAAEVIDLGLARIAADLVQRFAVSGQQRSYRQRLVVAGIDSPAHYLEVRRFLDTLDGIDALRLAAADGDTVEFELETRGDSLRRRLELSGPLAFERRDLRGGQLHYRFRP
ncbi:MAG: DUF2066 domain-containing protein [Wenzhouxiangellaceae bacterium]|nr:DUF2066 domain-containing protein [Wenzhouxiangellaceae bacterium]